MVFEGEEPATTKAMPLEKEKPMSLNLKLITAIKNLGMTVYHELRLLNLKLVTKMPWIVLKALSGIVTFVRKVMRIARQRN